MADRLRIVVLGMMGRCPFGGQTWLTLNWLRAFQRLDHDVWYVEDDTAWPYDPLRRTLTDDCSYAVSHVKTCTERIGLKDRWAFRFALREGACWGLSETALSALYRSADLLVGFGSTVLRDDHMTAKRRLYIESDPVMQQLRVANDDGDARRFLLSHTDLFTYGENYGALDCGVPLCGFTYKKTRQAVDLGWWPYRFDVSARKFTTIGNYRQEGHDIVYNGDVFRWSKHHEWEKVITLPSRTRQPAELAMSMCDERDRRRLMDHGWDVVSAYDMSLDVFGAYPDYIRRSRAEFTVAKDQNIRLRSGWFSERDACYLASGKPVIAQETGFSNILPTGEGLFAFTTMDEALGAIDAINHDYERHCRAARAIAEEYFEATKVAGALIGEI
jgi:hypothetical protein